MAQIQISITVALEVPDEDIIQWEADQMVSCLHKHFSRMIVGHELISRDSISEPAIIRQITTEWPADVASRAIKRFHAGLQSIQERTSAQFETLLTTVIAERKG